MADAREIRAWQMVEPGRPLASRTLPAPALSRGCVLVEVAGCGLCHTDLSFLYGGVKTRKPPPVTLGHEIAGTVVECADGAHGWLGKPVIVPAVIPCGACDLCRRGRGNACRQQLMPGNDMDGGFATHVAVPAHALCEVPPGDYALWELAIIADALSTPYQALIRAAVSREDLVVIVGAGGVGTYGVQLAAAMGATVIAVDVDAAKLDRIRAHGAADTVYAAGRDAAGVRDAVRESARRLGAPRHGWKVFEMSGAAAGQQAAFELLTYAGTVGIVGFTLERVPVRLSSLMALDAVMFGTWGCLPEHYPAVLALVRSGRVQLRPFIRRFALGEVNEVIAAAREHRLTERPILTP